MALTICRECGKGVSTEAPACPHCGVLSPARATQDRKRQRDVPLWVVVFVGILLVLLAALLTTGRATEKPQESSAPSHEQRLATAVISDAGHPCGIVITAINLPSGSIRATCSNGESYRVFALEGKMVAMRCSAVKKLGVDGC